MMFTMFAVVAITVGGIVAQFPEAYFVDTNEAVEPRVMAANAAHAVVAMRAA